MRVLKYLFHSHGAEGDQSLMKTVTFAITHFTVAFTVAYVLTGDIIVGSLIAMIEPAINTVAYFFHEKIWSKRAHDRQQMATLTQSPSTST